MSANPPKIKSVIKEALVTHLFNTTTISMLEYGNHPVCDIVSHTKTEAIQLGHDLPQLPFTQLK